MEYPQVVVYKGRHQQPIVDMSGQKMQVKGHTTLAQLLKAYTQVEINLLTSLPVTQQEHKVLSQRPTLQIFYTHTRQTLHKQDTGVVK